MDLSAALLYQIMAAEIAMQRGDAGSAFATLLKAARDTRDARLARRATEIAIANRSSPAALEAVVLWRELAPKSTEAVQAHAALLVAAGRYDEATPVYASQLAGAADRRVALARIQRALSNAPEPARAFALFERLARPLADDPDIGFDVRMMLAQAAIGADLPARAAEEAQAAARMKPDSESAAILSARLLAGGDSRGATATGDPKAAPNEGRRKALAQLRQFVASHPEARQARNTYARLLVSDNQFDAAAAEFETLVKQAPDDADSLFALGLLAMQQERRPQARAWFERYLGLAQAEAPPAATPDADGDSDAPAVRRRDPTSAWLNLARIAEDDRDYDRALGWLTKAEAGTDPFAAKMRRAMLLGKMKRLDEGRKVLASVTPSNDEERSQVVLAEGQMLREAGRYKESFQLLDAAAARRPQDTAILYDAAMAAEKVDQLEAMEKHLRQVIALRPDHAHAYNALGYSLADRNLRLDESRALIEQARALAPDDPFILDSEGWVWFRLGDLQKAKALLERSWQMRPEADVAAHLGEVLWALGERDAARRIWRDGRARDPQNETLESTLRRLKVRL